MRRIWPGLWIAVVLAATPAAAAARQDAAVLLGGTDGFPSLGDPAASAQFRATGRGGLYVHYNATEPGLFGPALPGIAKAFAGTGGGAAELGLFHPGFFGREWRGQLIAKGLAPKVALVNMPSPMQMTGPGFDPALLARFKAFVDEGRQLGGVQIIAPILSPNSSGGKGPAGDAATLAVARPWADPWWDNARAAALYGGGIAMDTPPAFYLHGLPDPAQVRAYQAFEQAQLVWAAQNHVAAFVIVSPYFDAGMFMQNAQAQYGSLAAAGALPTTWVIENYNTCDAPYPKACTAADAAYHAPVGTESEAGTEAAVALWFARNAKVRPYAGTYAGALAP